MKNPGLLGGAESMAFLRAPPRVLLPQKVECALAACREHAMFIHAGRHMLLPPQQRKKYTGAQEKKN